MPRRYYVLLLPTNEQCRSSKAGVQIAPYRPRDRNRLALENGMYLWYGLLAVAVLFNGAANVLMKAGMQNSPGENGLLPLIMHYLHSWPVMLGLLLFALNVVAYTQALTKIPLSVAYPIMVSLTGVIVISGSLVLFKEEIGWFQWIGFALILGGVICVTR